MQDTLDLGAAPGAARAGSRSPAGRPRVPARRGPRAPRPDAVPAAALPVARVAVDVGLAHLDRPFDYLVPEALATDAVPGARVRVRFAGALVSGFVLDRVAESAHGGALTPLHAVISREGVVTPEIARLARSVADRWAGTLSDVLRLAVPPRHARVEKEGAGIPDAGSPDPGSSAAGSPAGSPDAVLPGAGHRIPGGGAAGAPTAGDWDAYAGGPAFLAALAAGGSPRAAWPALPGPTWPGDLAAAVAATAASGRGSVMVVPDARDLARVDAALLAALGPGVHVALAADLGPAERYRRWLRILRGDVLAVVGTRAAVWAPVRDLGLMAVWDDGDDSLVELRAPYPHSREVAVLRAHQQGAGLLLGSLAPSVETVALLRSGWLRPVGADRATVRRRAPRVLTVGSDAELARDPAARAARLPKVALAVAREGIDAGLPVLIQVPRRGYQPGLSCERCRSPARCTACAGPLGVPAAGAAPACRWCGRLHVDWACGTCGGSVLRAVVVGERRTAEELGRALPGATVRTSGGDAILDSIPAGPSLVVSTPGAEPVAPGDGYAAALLLDGWALLGRADLRAAEETVRRWTAAASLVRPGGTVVLGADPGIPAVQALIRWDAAGFAAREADERSALRFPPAVRMAAVEGPAAAVADLLAEVVLSGLPLEAEVLGPVPWQRRVGSGRRGPGAQPDGDEPWERALIRVPPVAGAALAAALATAQRLRSARKAEPVRVELDPRRLA